MLSRIAGAAVPVVLLNWNDPSLKREMQNLGAEVYRLPSFEFGARFDHFKSRIDLWHRYGMRSPSTLIDRRRKFALMKPRDRYKNWIRESYLRSQACWPGATSRFRKNHEQAFWTDTNVKQIGPALEKLKPDAVFSITPIRIEEEPVLRLAKKWSLPCCTSILSFDNLTTRGALPIVFDAYLLWNKHNAGEVQRLYPEARNSTIGITGPPQFDFYRDKSYIWDSARWRAELGLPDNRPVIFFGGGFQSVVPHEPLYLAQLDQAIERREIRNNPVVLFRRHPVDSVDRWTGIIQNSKNIVLDTAWPASESEGNVDIKRYDIERLASTLFHSDMHINTSSTLTVDGALFDRPQVGPAYDDTPGKRFDRIAKDLYLREHYLPITNSGGLDIAHCREELVEAVNAGLDHPGRLTEGRKKIVNEICTYGDGKCALRVARSLASFVAQGVLQPPPLKDESLIDGKTAVNAEAAAG